MKDNQREIISRRKVFLNAIKRNNKVNYNFNAAVSRCYNGEGFYVNHREKTTQINKIWGYDKHWAYGGVLKYKEFPLSNKLGDKETSLGLYLISYKSMKPRYTDFYYTLYLRKNSELDRDIVILKDKRTYRFISNLDYEIFKDMYEVEDLKIEAKSYFQEIGKLNIDDVIDAAYIDKKNADDERKPVFESVYYGLNARKLWEYETFWDQENYMKSVLETGYNYCRSEYTVIALFQAAYLRYEEWQLFKKYKDIVVYMNTDSIYTTEPIDLGEDKGIGYYGKEYEGEKMLFIRRNAYAILSDDEKSFKKSIIGGVINQTFTEEQINKLKAGESIKALTRNKNQETVEIDLNPDFIQYHLGTCNNIKYL